MNDAYNSLEISDDFTFKLVAFSASSVHNHRLTFESDFQIKKNKTQTKPNNNAKLIVNNWTLTRNIQKKLLNSHNSIKTFTWLSFQSIFVQIAESYLYTITHLQQKTCIIALQFDCRSFFSGVWTLYTQWNRGSHTINDEKMHETDCLLRQRDTNNVFFVISVLF